FLVEFFHDIDSFFINQRLSKLESFIDKWREGKEIWIKAYLQLIHNALGITETEKLVNLYNSFFTDKVVLWDESVKKVKWI
nr:hypothetical protein [Escherichia coli]